MSNTTVLRVVMTNYFPFSNGQCPNAPLFKVRPSCFMPGIVNEILGIVADIAGFKIVPIYLEEVKFVWFSYTKTITTYLPTIFGMIYNETVETTAIPLEYTPSLEVDFQLSHIVYDLNFKFYVFNEDFGANWWNMFRVYDSRTWIAMFFFLIVQCSLCGLVQMVQNKYIQEEYSLKDKIWEILRLQLLQSSGPRFRLVSGNFLVLIFALFQCAVILGIFTSYFLSIMVRMDSNSKEMIAKMKYDLLHNRRHLITTTKNEWLKYKDDKFHLIPGMRKREGMVSFYEYAEDAIQAVHEKNAILVAQDNEYAAYLAGLHCDIIKLDIGSPPLSSHFIFPKSFPHLDRFNDALKIGRSKIKAIHDRYSLDRSEVNNCKHFKMGDPLRLNSYLGVLLICAGGMSVGAALFISELFFKKFKLNKS